METARSIWELDGDSTVIPNLTHSINGLLLSHLCMAQQSKSTIQWAHGIHYNTVWMAAYVFLYSSLHSIHLPIYLHSATLLLFLALVDKTTHLSSVFLSRLMVVSHEAMKKQHACAFLGLRDHYSELFKCTATLKFIML